MDETTKLTLSQKVLFGILFGLFVLMIIFSVLATRNLGEEGYQRCVEKKCQERGEDFCSKQRELVNCCQGAGGVFSVNQVSGGLQHTTCRFD